MKATIFDIQTGESWTINGPRSYEWAEGGWSCDCNRHALGWEGDICEGSKRFLVVGAEFDGPDDYTYTLRELNERYPEKILSRYLPD